MHASLLRRWLKRTLIAGSIIVLLPGITVAAWPWSKPAPQPVIPVGPPIYTPTTPTVVNYQPATTAPSNSVPAASMPPTLSAPPATTFAPSTTLAPSTTVTPAPATTYAPAPTATVVTPAPTYVAPATCGPAGCGTCGTTPRVTNYVPPTYRTNWQAVPTTTYRPVAAVDPVTGLPINAVAPCTTNVWQARRVPNTLWGGLWPSTSAPPTVVAYTPATIATYPAARVTNHAPPPTILVPRPGVVQYAPAPVVTQYAPATTITNYAPATTIAPAPTTTFAPSTSTIVPSTTVPSTTLPSTTPPGTFPSTTTDPSACPPGTVMPSNGQTYVPPTSTWPSQTLPSTGTNGTPSTQYPSNGVNGTNGQQPADLKPRLDSRNYAPQQYDDEPMVPVNPPATERRVLETPRIEGPSLKSPANNTEPNNSSWNQRSPSPFVPFARPAEKPASTPVPERNLRLVPDPDAERLDLRRNEIPNLIKPGDRTTSRPAPNNFASAPVQPPERATIVQRPVVELQHPQTRPVAASIPAASEKLDDSGWQQVGR